MQERAALVGATLQIESSVGQGTTVLVRMTAAAAAADTHATHG
jgi:signal transduction histidine kinase